MRARTSDEPTLESSSNRTEPLIGREDAVREWA